MVAIVNSCTLVGSGTELVDVECTISRGLPHYSAIGLAVPSVKDGATRPAPLSRPPATTCRSRTSRMVADLLDQDEIDAGCLLQTAAHRDVDPTVDLMPCVR